MQFVGIDDGIFLKLQIWLILVLFAAVICLTTRKLGKNRFSSPQTLCMCTCLVVTEESLSCNILRARFENGHPLFMINDLNRIFVNNV